MLFVLYHFIVASCLQIDNPNVPKYINNRNLIQQPKLSFLLKKNVIIIKIKSSKKLRYF